MFEIFLEWLLVNARIPTSKDMDKALDGVDDTGKRMGPLRRFSSVIVLVSGILSSIALLIFLVLLPFVLLSTFGA